MPGAKFHRFIRLEQERLNELRQLVVRARNNNRPILASLLRIRCFFLQRWVDNHRHILNEKIERRGIPEGFRGIAVRTERK